MNQTEKCCEKCEWIDYERDEYDRGIGLTSYCRNSKCPCHIENKNTLSELIEQEMERFEKEFGGRIYMMQHGKSPIEEHLATTKLKTQWVSDLKIFLKEAMLKAAKATEKAGEVGDLKPVNEEPADYHTRSWNANNAERRRRLQAWLGEKV